MTEKTDKHVIKNRILVLQKMTLRTGKLLEDTKLQKENCDHNAIKTNKRRYTASSYIFDEEPFFSDSEEETEYCKLLTTRKSLDYTHETSENLSVAIQCNLYSEELELIDIIKKCAGINSDKVNEDFKQLIELCRQLQFKYKHGKYVPLPPLISEKGVANFLTSKEFANVSCCNNSIHIPTITHISSTENGFSKEMFLPSRNGNSGDGSDGFASETFNSNRVNLNCNSIIESIDAKHRVLRRSNRKRKCIGLNDGMYRATLPFSNKKEMAKKERIRIETNSVKKQLSNRNIRKNKPKAVLRGGGRDKKENTKCLVNPRAVVNLEDPSNVCQRVPVLSKNQARSLARSWMKPNKSVVENYRISECNKSDLSLKHERKSRRLYSPTRWMDSQQSNNLLHTNRIHTIL